MKLLVEGTSCRLKLELLLVDLIPPGLGILLAQFRKFQHFVQYLKVFAMRKDTVIRIALDPLANSLRLSVTIL